MSWTKDASNPFTIVDAHRIQEHQFERRIRQQEKYHDTRVDGLG